MRRRASPARSFSRHAGAAAVLSLFLGSGAAVESAKRANAPPDGRAPQAPLHASAPPKQDACAKLRRELSSLPALPGAPKLEARRAEVFARSRAEPVLFLEAPVAAPPSARARAVRERLFSENPPYAAFDQAFRSFHDNPEELRAVFLTDGYLYAEDPTLAALFTSRVTLAHLFRDKELRVRRGEHTLGVVSSGGDYVWADGRERGKPARLWLFDRVAAAKDSLQPDRHVGVRHIGTELGTRSIEIERLTARGVLARLRYDSLTINAVLEVREGRLELVCEEPGAATERLAAEKGRARRLERVLIELQSRIQQQIDEALPFDEPKTEDGQQDGKLRPEWRTAYQQGARAFTFNGDRYPVFDGLGRPRVPQVCADFILDTWERMAGTRWLGQPEGRGRKVGRLDFSALEIENRRSVEQLIEYARTRPEWFELAEVPEPLKVQFRDRSRFFGTLFENRADYRPLDVVAILGPRDDERLHYHSFFIVAADPLSGMPLLLAANAGRPRIRNWEAELESAPRRGIVARIRPRLEWLESLLEPQADALKASQPVTFAAPG